MKKENLTIGNVVEFRNGQRALIICSTLSMNLQFLFSSGGIIDVNDNMIDFSTLLSKEADKYDVMSIYSTHNPVRRLSDIGNLDNLKKIESRGKEMKKIKLVEFTEEVFHNSSRDVQASFAGLGKTEAFRENESYILVTEGVIEGQHDLTEIAKNYFLKELEAAANGKLSEDTILSICCPQDSKDFKYGFHFKLDTTNLPEFQDGSGRNIVNFMAWFNSDTIAKSFGYTGVNMGDLGGDISLANILGMFGASRD